VTGGGTDVQAGGKLGIRQPAFGLQGAQDLDVDAVQ
jgi:hypothetical protein